jgi:predicted DNA-binding protein (UPF0251 family)
VEVQDVVAVHEDIGEIFDREYAQAVVKDASERQKQLAGERGEAALQRVELLHLRFYEGLPIREIAERWGVEPAVLHRQYARARDEFLAALLEVVAASQPSATHAENQAACKELIAML